MSEITSSIMAGSSDCLAPGPEAIVTARGDVASGTVAPGWLRNNERVMKNLKLTFVGLHTLDGRSAVPIRLRPATATATPLGGGLPAPPQPIEYVDRKGRSESGMMGRMPWWAWV